jgi:hypothetical protein
MGPVWAPHCTAVLTQGATDHQLVMESKVDFMSVGTFGRKDHDDDKHLGSTGAEPLKLMSCGCFVVKNTSVIPTDEPMTWLVAR